MLRGGPRRARACHSRPGCPVTNDGRARLVPQSADGGPRSGGRWYQLLVGHAEGLCRLAAYSASVLVAAPFLYHLMQGSSAHLGLLEDDYYYYATIADNLV